MAPGKAFSFKGFLDSDAGSILISVLVGLGLATLFRKACSGYGCYVVHGPPLRDLKKYVYKQDGRCYKYTPVATECDSVPSDSKPTQAEKEV